MVHSGMNMGNECMSEKMENPLISVIIPVYKVEKWLEQCVESVQNQTYQNLEIILVDDGSPDRCGEICDRFARKDPRIRVIHKENGGLSDARNCGLDLAGGEYICFVDSDDYIEPAMLEVLYQEIKKTSASIAVCDYEYAYDELEDCLENPMSKKRDLEEEIVLTGREFICLKQSKHSICVVVWNKLYQKEVWKNVRFPKGKIHEDEFVFHKIMYPCHRIVCVPHVGYHYRLRKNSITSYCVQKNGIISTGGNEIHACEAFRNQCEYFAQQNDAEMVRSCENDWSAYMRQRWIYGDQKNRKEIRKEYISIEQGLLEKNYISIMTYIRRRILFYAEAPLEVLYGSLLRKCRKNFPTVYLTLKHIKHSVKSIIK